MIPILRKTFPPPPIILLLSALLAAAATSEAGLTWEHVYFEGKAHASERRATIAFPFKNTGARPVTIRRIHSSCSCTTARLRQRTYQPGEEGLIETVFTFGHRRGLHQQTIIVQTDDPEKPRQTLVLRIDIAE